jgi:hypothetical protein
LEPIKRHPYMVPPHRVIMSECNEEHAIQGIIGNDKGNDMREIRYRGREAVYDESTEEELEMEEVTECERTEVARPHQRQLRNVYEEDLDFDSIIFEDGDSVNGNDGPTGDQEDSEAEADTDLEESMEQVISELVTLQKQWVNRRDLGDMIAIREEGNLV